MPHTPTKTLTKSETCKPDDLSAELDRDTDLAGALVGDGGVLLVAGEEEDGGEAADVHAGHLDLVGGRVHLSCDRLFKTEGQISIFTPRV